MLKRIIAPALRAEKIAYVAALPYEACRVQRPYLVERLHPFVPQSVVLFLVPYYAGLCENLSCYAAAKDYHLYMRGLFDRICPQLRAACGYTFYGFADHSPIDERHAAASAGLGVIGKNGLLINERYGTFVFIGELLTDAPPAVIGAQAPREIGSCAGCGACLRACPTGCLRDAGQACLSAITQKKGMLDEKERALIVANGSVWGCDRCQTACPHNRVAMQTENQTPIAFFREDRITRLTSDMLDAMTDEAFAERAFSFRGRAPLLRNLSLFDT